MKTILFHAREAGVASMMASLLQPLKNCGYNIVYDVADQAANILKYKNVSFVTEDIDLAICGYDSKELDRTGDFLKKLSSNVPTLGLLDSWKGVDRFWNLNGELRPLTDKLIVPDEVIQKYLIDRGVPHDWPVIGGHPGLEQMQNLSKDVREELKRKSRESYGLNKNDKALLFLSEPLRLPGNKRLSLLDAKVKDTRTVQQWITDTYGHQYCLAARFHPIENQNIPNEWIDANKLQFESALALADLVIGLGSTTLAYAVAYGLDVQCIDKQMAEWKPEYSEIPSEFWDSLVINGIFQNNPERLISDSNLMYNTYAKSTKCILSEIEKLIN